MSMMTPQEIVSELDKHIVGQQKAKRAVAIALRNRWRRQQVPEPLKTEITPKNILMIGPTGVGKTEIARRLARLANAPFVKVEATKFTEVGYVGRDVDTIIRDLVEVSMKDAREAAKRHVAGRASDAAEDRVLDVLVPPPRDGVIAHDEGSARQHFRKLLREGKLDDKEIEIDLNLPQSRMEIMGPQGMEELTAQLESMFSEATKSQKKTRKLPIQEALRLLQDEEANRLVDMEETKSDALNNAEQNGIVFIDEIDKIATRESATGSDVSRAGVQRDLLPLIEGTTVTTKYGPVKTDHILFIASGAFHLSRPSDLIPELQGRLPIRVELDALTVDDFQRILTDTDACLTRQYQALLATEGVSLDYATDGVKRLAEIAFETNERHENIGARRLATVMERLLDEVSFAATQFQGQAIVIDSKYVDDRLADIVAHEDLAQYIL